MTHFSRRIVLMILFIPVFFGILTVIGTALSLLWGLLPLPPSATMVWWGIMRVGKKDDLLWSAATLAGYVLISLIGEIALRKSFKRSSSQEMFFLRMFVLILPLQALRLLILGVLGDIMPSSIGLLVTRIAWFGRFVGITALLNMGLYSNEVPFRRSGPILIMGVLVSLAIAVMMPLDITQPMGNLIYRTGVDTALALSCISLEFLAIISLLGMGYQNNHFYVLALGVALIAIGFDISFFGYRIFAVAGLTLVIAGIILFAKYIRKIYQWL